MIQLSSFSIGYGPRTLLDNVNTSFDRGRLTAVIGRNGTGKSTLLRAIAGLNSHYTGKILLGGRDIVTLQPPELAKTLAFVTTGRIRVPNLSCEDVVAIGRSPYTNWIGHMQETDRNIVREAMGAVGMESYARRSMDTMSDGECQRIMIARALAQDTPIILLDEPTAFLDIPNRYELIVLLRSLARNQNKCILYSTHDLDVALRMCDTIALADGGALYHLPVADMVAGGRLQRLFHTPFHAQDNPPVHTGPENMGGR